MIDVVEQGEQYWRYKLMPVTGRKHQLRVQMAGLGVGILGDRMHPELLPDTNEFEMPLRLMAKGLAFQDR